MYLQSIQSVKHNAAKSVNRSILKKSRHIGFGVFIVLSSMFRSAQLCTKSPAYSFGPRTFLLLRVEFKDRHPAYLLVFCVNIYEIPDLVPCSCCVFCSKFTMNGVVMYVVRINLHDAQVSVK
jgi:hypothetical protein